MAIRIHYLMGVVMKGGCYLKHEFGRAGWWTDWHPRSVLLPIDSLHYLTLRFIGPGVGAVIKATYSVVAARGK